MDLLRAMRRELDEQKVLIGRLQADLQALKHSQNQPPAAHSSSHERQLSGVPAGGVTRGTIEVVDSTLNIAAPKIGLNAAIVGIGGIGSNAVGSLQILDEALNPDKLGTLEDPPLAGDLVLGDLTTGNKGGSYGLRRGMNSGFELRARQFGWVPPQWNAQLYQSARNSTGPYFPFNYFGNTIIQAGNRGSLVLASNDATLGISVPRINGEPAATSLAVVPLAISLTDRSRVTLLLCTVNQGHNAQSDPTDLAATTPLTVDPDGVSIAGSLSVSGAMNADTVSVSDATRALPIRRQSDANQTPTT